MLPGALVLVLAAAPQAIVFAGGVSEADGDRALASLQKLEPFFSKIVTWAQGQPRRIETSTLPGLKPGFHVVTLGICADPSDVLPTLKAIYPGTYVKPLEGKPAEQCPRLKTDGVAALEKTVKGINAFEVTTDDEDRGRALHRSTLGFVLVEKKTGEVLDTAQLDGADADQSGEGPAGTEYVECGVSVRAEKTGFVVVRSCSDERTGCRRDEDSIPRAWTETVHVSVKGTALSVSTLVRQVTSSSACEESSEEGGD